jgi:hypothetical protein
VKQQLRQYAAPLQAIEFERKRKKRLKATESTNFEQTESKISDLNPLCKAKDKIMQLLNSGKLKPVLSRRNFKIIVLCISVYGVEKSTSQPIRQLQNVSNIVVKDVKQKQKQLENSIFPQNLKRLFFPEEPLFD